MAFMQRADIGVQIQVTITESDEATVVNVSDADTKTLTFRAPSGETFTVDAAFTDSSGADGILTWTTAVDSESNPYIAEVGQWSVQAYWTTSGGDERRSTITVFDVYENITD